MNAKENLIAALKHEKIDRIPWIPLIGGANTPCIVPIDIKDDNLQSALFLNREIGCDIYIHCEVINMRFHDGNISTFTSGDKTETVFEFRGVKLKKVDQNIAYKNMLTSSTIEYPIKDLKDLDLFIKMMEKIDFDLDLEKYRFYNHAIGEKGLIYIASPESPMMNLVLNYMGIENFTFLLADYREEMEELMKVMQKFYCRCYKAIAQSDSEIFIFQNGEHTESNLISPRLFERYALPSLREYCQICHENEKLFAMHSCGNVRIFLDLLAQTGYDAHNMLQDAPSGNTPFGIAKNAWGDNITIMGAVDSITLATGTPEQVRNDILGKFAVMQPGNAFALTHVFKPDIPIENIIAVRDTVKEFGRYPIII